MEHETMVAVLRAHPERLRALVALTHPTRKVPPRLRVEDSAVRFADPAEVRPNLVLLDRGSRYWALVEVQRKRDAAKARRWPLAMQNGR